MRKWGKCAALLLFLFDFGISHLAAGPMSPYKAVLLDGPERTLLLVNMDNGERSEIQIPAEIMSPNLVAIDWDRSVYVYDNIVDSPDRFRSIMAHLDPALSEWTTTILDRDIDSPEDMELTPDGTFIIGSEFDIYDIDLAAMTVRLSDFQRTGPFVGDGGTIDVEMNSSGTVTTGGVRADDTTILFRQAPDVEVAERFDTGIWLADFVLDVDGSSVIGAQIGSGSLYRLDFDTKSIDLLFESDLLADTHQIEVDTNGRIVALTRQSALSHRIVRVDLGRGTADLITELEGHHISDIDLLPVEGIPVEGLFQAGDADMDLDFDQFDLVKVHVASKYLTGQPATWGEGDWDGAPGGFVGNPPAGDGVFDQLDIIAALNAAKYLTGPYGALAPNGREDDGQTSIIYNAGTGELGVNAPSGSQLTSINIDSAAGIFTGDAAQNLAGSFDNDSDNNIFKATFGSSFGSLSFGNVAQPGLSRDFLVGDLNVVGSLAGGSDLGDVDLIYVPEPTSLALSVMLAASLVVAWRMKNGVPPQKRHAV